MKKPSYEELEERIKELEKMEIIHKKTEEAFKRYEQGDFKEMDFDEFLKEADRW